MAGECTLDVMLRAPGTRKLGGADVRFFQSPETRGG